MKKCCRWEQCKLIPISHSDLGPCEISLDQFICLNWRLLLLKINPKLLLRVSCKCVLKMFNMKTDTKISRIISLSFVGCNFLYVIICINSQKLWWEYVVRLFISWSQNLKELWDRIWLLKTNSVWENSIWCFFFI